MMTGITTLHRSLAAKADFETKLPSVKTGGSFLRRIQE